MGHQASGSHCLAAVSGARCFGGCAKRLDALRGTSHCLGPVPLSEEHPCLGNIEQFALEPSVEGLRYRHGADDAVLPWLAFRWRQALAVTESIRGGSLPSRMKFHSRT